MFVALLAVSLLSSLCFGKENAFTAKAPFQSTEQRHRSPFDSPPLRGVLLARPNLLLPRIAANTPNDGALSTTTTSKRTRVTALHALIFLNGLVYLLDKVFQYRFVAKHFYLFLHCWTWWQPLTSCFCHGNAIHLSTNLILLCHFGRTVEEAQGWGGLLLTYVFCGVVASLSSLVYLPKYADADYCIGASGAIFGLLAVSTFIEFWSCKDILVELAKYFLFEVVFCLLRLENVTTAASGATIDHVGHLSGAAAGSLLGLWMRYTGRLSRRDSSALKVPNKEGEWKRNKWLTSLSGVAAGIFFGLAVDYTLSHAEV